MFTIEQIKEAHSRVKSGADFPAYIRDLKALGVRSYQTFVADGHTDFYGADNYTATAPARHAGLTIASTCNIGQFKTDLKAHQQGKSDYPTFLRLSAAHGIEKWQVSMEKMTCTYLDTAGNGVLVETIPTI